MFGKLTFGRHKFSFSEKTMGKCLHCILFRNAWTLLYDKNKNSFFCICLNALLFYLGLKKHTAFSHLLAAHTQ